MKLPLYTNPKSVYNLTPISDAVICCITPHPYSLASFTTRDNNSFAIPFLLYCGSVNIHVLIFMIQLCLLMPLFQNIFNIFLVSLLQNTKRTTVVSYFLLHSITKQGDKSLISLKLTIRILSCEALKLKVHIQSSEALKLKVCTQSSNALKSSKLSCSFILYAIIMKNTIKNLNFYLLITISLSDV